MERNLRSYTKRSLRRRKPFLPLWSATNWLILINVVAFFIGYFILATRPEYIALKPSDILQGKYLWTFLTSMFMHGGIFHLFVNMFVLFSLGTFCEQVIGKKRFVWFYILSGLFAGLAFVLLAGFFGGTEMGARIFGSPDIFGVGASGAIFAIAGLFMILTPQLKFTIIFFPFFFFAGVCYDPACAFCDVVCECGGWVACW